MNEVPHRLTFIPNQTIFSTFIAQEAFRVTVGDSLLGVPWGVLGVLWGVMCEVLLDASLPKTQ